LKEYNRTSSVLVGCSSHKALFLRGYSTYLAGEKRKEEEIQELGEQTPALNKELKKLKAELLEIEEGKSSTHRRFASSTFHLGWNE